MSVWKGFLYGGGSASNKDPLHKDSPFAETPFTVTLSFTQIPLSAKVFGVFYSPETTRVAHSNKRNDHLLEEVINRQIYLLITIISLHI